jgi:hypothetical protein
MTIIMDKGGPRLWATLSCLNTHWKQVSEEYAAAKMNVEARMEKIPLNLRYQSFSEQLGGTVVCDVFDAI